jgi:hypothetical protein
MTTRHRHIGTSRSIGLLLALIIAWAAFAPSLSYAAEQGETRVGVRSQESGVRSAGRSANDALAQFDFINHPTKPATPWVDDPFATIGAKLETTAKNVAKIATPVAIICIVIVLVMYLFAPLLPDIAQQHKGYIIRALVIVAMIGFIPELVKAVAAFGGSS